VVTATVVSPLGQRVTRGAVLAHGGTDDGRRFFLSEAAAMAAGGAIVILPVTRMRPQDGIDIFAATVRTAVLTERAALDVLVEMGAPPDTLCFLGHSAGGFLGAILAAVEPLLARIVIFSYGAGTLIRTSLATTLSCGGPVTNEMTCAAEWFDAARFVAVDRRAELLIQHGRRDRDVPVKAGREMFDAAAPPKLWLEYDWDQGAGRAVRGRHRLPVRTGRGHHILDAADLAGQRSAAHRRAAAVSARSRLRPPFSGHLPRGRGPRLRAGLPADGRFADLPGRGEDHRPTGLDRPGYHAASTGHRRIVRADGNRPQRHHDLKFPGRPQPGCRGRNLSRRSRISARPTAVGVRH